MNTMLLKECYTRDYEPGAKDWGLGTRGLRPRLTANSCMTVGAYAPHCYLAAFGSAASGIAIGIAEQVRHIIMEHGVSLIQFALYRSFGLHVDKLCRDYSGETLRARALDAVLRWQCYGCNPDVLRAIVKSVFALDVPSPSESRQP